MATTQAKQALRQSRREKGLCIHCGSVAIRNQTRCTDCAKRDSDNRKKYAARDAARGICKNTGCSNPVSSKKNYCDSCSQKSADRTKQRREVRVASGLCAACGKRKLWNGKTRCRKCHKKLLENVKHLGEKRIGEGRCGRCGLHVLVPGYKSCEKCIAERSETHAQLKREVLAAYGGPVCVGCDETEICVLQIDHTDGSGSKHAKEIGGRGKMYTWLKSQGFPPGYRVLCANCNVRAARGKPFPRQK